jgi:hypothetical protein
VAVQRANNDNRRKILQDSLCYIASILQEGGIQNDGFDTTVYPDKTLQLVPKNQIPLGSKEQLFEKLVLSPPFQNKKYWPQVADLQQFLHDNLENHEQTYRILGGDTNTSLSLLDNFYVANAWLEQQPQDQGFESTCDNAKMRNRLGMPWDKFEEGVLTSQNLPHDLWKPDGNADLRCLSYFRQFLPWICFPVTNTMVESEAQPNA